MAVVEGGNVLHHVKRKGNCPGGGNVWGNMSDREMSRGNALQSVGKTESFTQRSSVITFRGEVSGEQEQKPTFGY